MHWKRPGQLLRAADQLPFENPCRRRERSETADATRKTLQQCVRADRSVLLPRIGASDEHKLFFVVANTQQRGAESPSTAEPPGPKETYRKPVLVDAQLPGVRAFVRKLEPPSQLKIWSSMPIP
jgi:hypothetical protein